MNISNDYLSHNTINQRDSSQQFFEPPPFGPPPGEPSQTPVSPPPYFSPPLPAWQYGPSGMQMCLFRNTYIWLRNGNSFWFYPTFITRNSIIGFRWRRFGWVYHIINPRSILSYIC